MMNNEIKKNLAEAVRIANSLFARCKTSGTTANISFRCGDSVWISRSGSCFETLAPEDFVEVGLDGTILSDGKPSKELPLHLALYASDQTTRAVIHTHAPYSTLWSCIPHDDPRNVIPRYTPYLEMKLGTVVEIPYAPPGSQELFSLMRERVGTERGYLLCNHGPIVAGRSLMNAFECLEELEQSAWLAWGAYSTGVQLRNL